MVEATCTAKAAQQKGLPISTARMMGLEVAARMLGGTDNLAGILDINPRSLRAKYTADRGIADGELVATAEALEEKAGKILAHAAKLRAEVAA